MKKIYVLLAFIAMSLMLTQITAQSAPKKAPPAKLNHGTTVKHIERDITGAAKNIEHKVEDFSRRFPARCGFLKFQLHCRHCSCQVVSLSFPAGQLRLNRFLLSHP